MRIEKADPPLPYCLSEGFLSGRTFEIDEVQYTALDSAISIVVAAREIEELFQIFAQSFIRFERDVLEIGLEDAYTRLEDMADFERFFSSVRNRFNVSIITILTAYQSYVDQSDRILKYTGALPTAREFNKQNASEVFDASLSYRVCDQLRNFAQHQALPLGGFSVGADADFVRDDAGRLRKVGFGHGVSPWLNVERFKAAPKIKPIVRHELDHLGYEKIDMKWLIRSFVAAMYTRHTSLRDYLRPEVEAAGTQIDQGYDFASAAKGTEAKFLELHGDGKKRPMRRDLAEKVLSQFETLKSLENAERRYVTSQIVTDATSYSGSDAGEQQKP